jgi:hypothetical protein
MSKRVVPIICKNCSSGANTSPILIVPGNLYSSDRSFSSDRIRFLSKLRYVFYDLVGRRYFSLASMKELLEPDDETKLAELPIPLAPVQ